MSNTIWHLIFSNKSLHPRCSLGAVIFDFLICESMTMKLVILVKETEDFHGFS